MRRFGLPGAGLLVAWLVGGHSPAGAVDPPRLDFGDDCARAGEGALLPVDLVPNGNSLAGAQFDVRFDPAVLTAGTPVGGAALADHQLLSNLVEPGVLRILVYSDTNSLLLPGRLCDLPFTVGAGVTGSGPSVMQVSNAWLATPLGQSIVPSPAPGPTRVSVVRVVDPAPTSACLGGSASLTASLAGLTGWTVQWTKGGTPVDGATSPSLGFSPLNGAHAGSYAAVFSAPCGVYTTASVSLSVGPPCAPATLEAWDTGAGGTVGLRWGANPSPEITNYRVAWGTSAGGPYPSFLDFGTALTGTATGLPNGTPVYLRAAAWAGLSEGASSPEATVVPTAGAIDLPRGAEVGYLAPPSNTTAHPDLATFRFPGRSGDVTIWATFYDVDYVGEIKVRVNGQFVLDAPSSGSNVWTDPIAIVLPDAKVNDATVNLLTFDQVAYPPTAERWGAKLVSIRLPPPVVASVPLNQTVDLSWTQSPAEPTLAKYEVYRGTTPTFYLTGSTRIASNVSGTSYRDQVGLVNGTTYYYVVLPWDSINNDGFRSAVVSATPTNAIVTPVRDLWVSKQGTLDVKLDWGAVTTQGGVQNYIVDEGLSPELLTDSGATPTTPTWVRLGDQADGVTHFYKVRVKDNSGRESGD